MHCFRCDATDHKIAYKKKRLKCFQCNEFRHISSKCTKSVETKRKDVNVIRIVDVKIVL